MEQPNTSSKMIDIVATIGPTVVVCFLAASFVSLPVGIILAVGYPLTSINKKVTEQLKEDLPKIIQ